jgi:hypothetical protein
MGIYGADGAGVRVVMHGQDGQAMLHTGDILMTVAADGHSDKLGGVAYSKYAMWLLPNRVLAIMPKIRDLVKQGKEGSEPLRKLMKDVFFALDVFLRNDCPYVCQLTPPHPSIHPSCARAHHARTPTQLKPQA